jgi:aminotransferase EvaB
VYYAEELGYNSRLDEVHAEILRYKLSKLDGYIYSRRKHATRYKTILAGTSLELPIVKKCNSHVYYVYVVRHPRRDELIAELKKKDILLNISYPWPIHLMRGYSYLGGKEGDLPITEAIAKTIFSLPMYPSLTEEMQNQTCLALGELLGEKVHI